MIGGKVTHLVVVMHPNNFSTRLSELDSGCCHGCKSLSVDDRFCVVSASLYP